MIAKHNFNMAKINFRNANILYYQEYNYSSHHLHKKKACLLFANILIAQSTTITD